MATAPRAPDILVQTAIPLSATSDQPLAAVVRPPVSASNDPTDQDNGTAPEISAEEMAAATAARKGPPEPETEPKAKPEAKADGEGEADDETPPELEFDPVPEGLPGYAVREIAKHRKQAQSKADAAWHAARAKVGDEAWEKALTTTRDAIIDTARKEAKTAREAMETAQRELAELKAKPPEPKAEEKPDERPTRDQFDDPDEYDTALTDWATREAERGIQAKLAEQRAEEEAAKTAETAEAERIEREAAQQVREAEIAKVDQAWRTQREAAVAKYPDYADVAEAKYEDGGPLISEAMAAGIVQTANGADIAYYLGTNREESVRIGSLTNPVLHFLEIGRLSERLANPPRRTRAAPRPLEPIDTSSNRADTTSDELEMNAYATKRNAQLARERRPFFPAH